MSLDNDEDCLLWERCHTNEKKIEHSNSIVIKLSIDLHESLDTMSSYVTWESFQNDLLIILFLHFKYKKECRFSNLLWMDIIFYDQDILLIFISFMF